MVENFKSTMTFFTSISPE